MYNFLYYISLFFVSHLERFCIYLHPLTRSHPITKMKRTITVLTVLFFTTSALMAQITMANSSKVIEMTNFVNKMYNSYISNMDKVRHGLNISYENMEALHKNKGATIYSWDCADIALRSDYKEAFQKSIKSAPSFPEKAEIQSQINYAEQYNEYLSDCCKALNDYYTKQEFKDDKNWAKYQKLYTELATAYTDMSKIWKKTIDLATDAGDRAELVTLKRNPISEFIIPMKTDLISARKIMNMYVGDYFDNSTMKKSVADLKRNIVKSRSLNGKRNISFLNKYNKKSAFSDFYKRMDAFLKVAVALETTYVPQQGDNNNLSLLINEYNSLIEIYSIM